MTTQAFNFDAKVYRAVDGPALFGELVARWGVEAHGATLHDAEDNAYLDLRDEIERAFTAAELPSYRIVMKAV